MNNRSDTLYLDPNQPIETRVEDLLARMTLAEKIGQMTQVEKNSISPEAVRYYSIGSVLSGGGGFPSENSPEAWFDMVAGFKQAALQTRLGIPLHYGVDAVHGHNNLHGATIFPHNIGLGATGDPDLVRRIGRVTAIELAATGIDWNFAPCLAVPQDIRWGRTYEGYGQDPDLVSRLGAAYILGMQGEQLQASPAVLATPKHYVGDGGTAWGSSTSRYYFGGVWSGDESARPEKEFLIDQGENWVNEETLRSVHLRPYVAALEAGARVVMASFSSWRGTKMHAHKYLLTDVLKSELGFSGFVVSDWGGIDQNADDYFQAVVIGVNAGIDMCMVPQDYLRFRTVIASAVESGDIQIERIDDAVRRILRVKFESGVFEQPLRAPALVPSVGAGEHRALAREAVAKSLVLLKNENQALPLSRSLPTLLVAGQHADDIGLQCGGWTIEWQGNPGAITTGTTILEAIDKTVSSTTEVDYDPLGIFANRIDLGEDQGKAPVGLAMVGELPYAEGFGDSADLRLSEIDQLVIERLRQRCSKLIVVVISGRPLILSEQLSLIDALVAAWLPGSEGQGVVDALFGLVPFSGRLPVHWPRSLEQLGQVGKPGQSPVDVLFPIGYGLE